MPKITEMYCFAVNDSNDDDEGVPAFDSVLGPMPMVGADLDRIGSLIPIAQIMANELGKPLRIYKFTVREQIGEVLPFLKETGE